MVVLDTKLVARPGIYGYDSALLQGVDAKFLFPVTGESVHEASHSRIQQEFLDELSQAYSAKTENVE